MLNVEKMRELRKKKGYTHQEVADRIGLTRAAYTNYESGIRTPNIETACKIAKLYGVKVEQLVK